MGKCIISNILLEILQKDQGYLHCYHLLKLGTTDLYPPAFPP